MLFFRKKRVLILAALSTLIFTTFGFLFKTKYTPTPAATGVHPDMSIVPITNACHLFFDEVLAKAKSEEGLKFEERIQAVRQFGNCFITHYSKVYQTRGYLEQIEKVLFPMLSRDWLFDPLEMSGSGIVVPVDDYSIDDVKRLMSVLNRTETTLPVHIVHTGQLTTSITDEIAGYGANLRIRFRDANQIITSDYQDLVEPDMSPWLALLMSDFDEIIYVEPNVVLFTDPEPLLLSDEHSSSGALLFRDRVIPNEFYSIGEQKMYNRLLPSREERIGFRMDLDASTDEIFERSILKHQVANGMFLFSKSRNLVGLLTAFASRVNEETNAPVYGSNELLWIGQLISGKPPLRFSEKNAAGIGQFVEENGSRYIYSTRIAQFDEKSRLLWMSGGFHNCQADTAQEDWKKSKSLRRKYKTSTELQDYYTQMATLEGALIPETDHSNSWVSSVSAWRGWQQAPEKGCHGYVWRAEDNPSHKAEIKVFTEDDLIHIEEMRKAWNLPL